MIDAGIARLRFDTAPYVLTSAPIPSDENVAMRARSVVSALLACTVLFTPAAAAVYAVNWQDLGAKINPAADPFYGLALEHKKNLTAVLRVASLRQRGATIDGELRAREAESRAALQAAKLDVDALVLQESRLREMIAADRHKLRTDLDGRRIRIPGYLVPLEYDGDLVTSFLLVPYSGACVHTPPPPANQIIHVANSEGFPAQGLFSPVWVTGELSVTMSRQRVDLSDGSAGFDVGYALSAESVQPYE